ncbi:MAG: lysophospholipid acyltransferase family protein [Candidatus Dormibacteria bacterium]
MSRSAPPARRRATSEDATVRIALHRLLGAVDTELERRRVEADLEPANPEPPVDIDRLSSLRRSLPDLLGLGARALRTAAQEPAGLGDAARLAAEALGRQRALRARLRTGADAVDEFGFDRQWTEATLLPACAWIYRHWWRVRALGLDNVPARGGAMLVANHAGVVPYDGAMIRTALLLEHATPRHARALVLDQLFALPVTSWLMRRTGNTLAHSADAIRLLDGGELVLVFPEGTKGTGKPYRERYRLRRFGRGGYAAMALRAQVPIIPISVVGSEEIHPMLANLAPLATLLGLPYAPITPTLPALGPLGAVPLPTSWIIEFGTPIPPEGDADNPADVLALSDRVRDTIQGGVYRNLERRGSVFA